MVRRVLGAVLALALIAAALLGITAAGIWSFSHVDEAEPSDAIVVLGASATAGEPSPVFSARIDHAIDLYERGFAGTIIFTGGTYEGEEYSEAESARRYALERGVPSDAIMVDERSYTTEENLADAKALMDARGLETAIVVSDPLHMARAMAMAGDAGIDAVSSPTPTSRYASVETKLPFLLRETYLLLGYRILSALSAVGIDVSPVVQTAFASVV